MSVEQIKGRFGDNYAYVVGDEKTKEGIVIDPSGLTDNILAHLRKEGLKIVYIFNTHGHSDHTGGNTELARETGAVVVKHAGSAGADVLAVNDGDSLRFGEMEAKIIHTPGHSADSISILVGKSLFTGDTLFINECGRTDLPGGSSEQLWDSLFHKIYELDDDVEVYPGHNYGPLPHDSLRNQKKNNYTLERRTLEEFIKFMLEP
ncbi:MAG: MBL fold metallo-hydrolase [Methanobacteriota archaeon]|nr:MAG: MBL fold metallo-hydrolase [Euryarchaeota archaeon]